MGKMFRVYASALLCLALVPACGSDDGETTTTSSETTTTTDTTDSSSSTTETTGEETGETGAEMCTQQFVAVASGTDAAGGQRPCGIAVGAQGTTESAAQAACGAGDTCYVQLTEQPGYCGVMVMSPDATQAWPGITADCNADALTETLLDQCKTAAGGIDCEVRCSECGVG